MDFPVNQSIGSSRNKSLDASQQDTSFVEIDCDPACSSTQQLGVVFTQPGDHVIAQ